MTTSQAHGGGAQPASIDTSGRIAGGVAMRVYGFASAADAQAAGYACEGGPAMSVALITDAQIASGAWRSEGDPSALVVYTAPANLPVEGGLAVPVYSVNGWGSTPAPVAPLFSSAEVGTVNASTVAVTFDQDVSASDYSAGVTIKVNGTATSITSAIRQSNHAIVYYVIPVLWHGSGDVVTWEYAEASGNIVADDDSTPLANVTAQSVTNNCEYAGLLDLQADTLVLNDGDPVSTWADQSGNSRNFTATGTARPTKQTISTYPAVVLDGSDDVMLGPNFGGGLSSFSILICFLTDAGTDIIMEKYSSALSAGWYFSYGWMEDDDEDGDHYLYASYAHFAPTRHILTIVRESNSSLRGLINGVDNTLDESNPPSVPAASSEIVTIGSRTVFGAVSIHAIQFLYPIPNATNRAALEARLAARYGVTYP